MTIDVVTEEPVLKPLRVFLVDGSIVRVGTMQANGTVWIEKIIATACDIPTARAIAEVMTIEERAQT